MKKIINQNEANQRLDLFLISFLNISRNKIQKMIATTVLVNGSKVKNGYIVKEKDLIEYELIDETTITQGENINLDIIYEDDDLLVINKQNGMVVHPGNGNLTGTLVNALINYTDKLSDILGDERPGIVHRIDAFTTGLLVVAKNNYAHEFLASQLKEKTLKRKYKALVWGVINNNTGEINAPIGRNPKNRQKMAVVNKGSKDAKTHFSVVKRFENATLLNVELETGRTHQIRVHMNFIGFPIVNDPVYGIKKTIDQTGQCLHAYEIAFIHPTSRKEMTFNCELPEVFNDILKQFKEVPNE